MMRSSKAAARFWELQSRGLAPEATIADFASGLRAGQHRAWPEVPCRGDLFHARRDFQRLSADLDQRAYTALATHEDRLRRQTRRVRRSGWRNPSLTRQATVAWRVSEQAIDLADEVRILLAWWQQDIMSVAGDDDATRSQLYDWVVQELRCREWRCPRIRVVRVRLENHRDELLAFAKQLDADLAALAEQFEVSEALLREVLALQQMDSAQPRCWQPEERW